MTLEHKRRRLRRRPKMIEETQDNRDSRWRVHLEWMFENQPDLAWQLHQQNRLGQHLDRKHQRALAMVDRLKAAGRSEDEAFEVAVASVLAPGDGPAMSDNPPDPLPLSQQRLVLERLRL